MPEIRDATGDDTSHLLELKERATADWGSEPSPPGSDRHAAQVAAFTHLSRTGRVVVAEQGGVVVGFGSAIVREDVWFLSQLFVDPEAQTRGAGAAILDSLLAESVARQARVRCVLSSADPRAFGLYVSRGMLPAWVMIEFRRRRARDDRPAPGTEPLHAEDQPEVDAIERAVRGFARPEDHAFFGEAAQGHALRRNGRLEAFFYVRSDGRVAPLAAGDDEALLAAIDAADALAGPEPVWMVPSVAPALIRGLLALDYRPGYLTTFCTDGPLGPFDRIAPAGGLLL